MAIRVHLHVSGKVQGVGFRYHTQSTATRLGVGGWVRNTQDGRVEIVVEGEEAIVEKFLAWCRQGPTSSKVDEVAVEKRESVSSAAPTFDIRR